MSSSSWSSSLSSSSDFSLDSEDLLLTELPDFPPPLPSVTPDERLEEGYWLRPRSERIKAAAEAKSAPPPPAIPPLANVTDDERKLLRNLILDPLKHFVLGEPAPQPVKRKAVKRMHGLVKKTHKAQVLDELKLHEAARACQAAVSTALEEYRQKIADDTKLTNYVNNLAESNRRRWAFDSLLVFFLLAKNLMVVLKVAPDELIPIDSIRNATVSHRGQVTFEMESAVTGIVRVRVLIPTRERGFGAQGHFVFINDDDVDGLCELRLHGPEPNAGEIDHAAILVRSLTFNETAPTNVSAPAKYFLEDLYNTEPWPRPIHEHYPFLENLEFSLDEVSEEEEAEGPPRKRVRANE